MASFGGSLEDTFHSTSPPEVVCAHFADLRAIAAATQDMESSQEVGVGTLRFVLREQRQGPYRFQPEYTVRYHMAGDSVVWSTLEGNLKSEGTARFAAASAGGTEIIYSQSIAFDLPLPRLAVPVVKPIVDRLIRPSMRAYVKAMLASVPR